MVDIRKILHVFCGEVDKDAELGNHDEEVHLTLHDPVYVVALFQMEQINQTHY